MIEYGKDSFALPSHVKQVIFSDCPEALGWKVIIRTEPRGKRVVASEDEVEDGFLFRHRRDHEFEGLRMSEEVPEDLLDPVAGGRVLRVEDLFSGLEVENAEVFDRDVGASSDEE
jgi:hypothetical protein